MNNALQAITPAINSPHPKTNEVAPTIPLIAPTDGSKPIHSEAFRAEKTGEEDAYFNVLYESTVSIFQTAQANQIHQTRDSKLVRQVGGDDEDDSSLDESSLDGMEDHKIPARAPVNAKVVSHDSQYEGSLAASTSTRPAAGRLSSTLILVAEWEQNFQWLLDYRKEHGDCNVPPSHSNVSLATWVQTLREQYRKRNEGSKETSPSPDELGLTENHIKRLEGIGFVWAFDTSWEDMFLELRAYKEEHGDCLVPFKHPNQHLVNWVRVQRKMYENEQDKPCRSPAEQNIVDSRIKRLEDLGFVWFHGTQRYAGIWEENFKLLSEYKKVYGHCNLPYKYDPNLKLGYWVHTQRKAYKKRLQVEQEHGPYSRQAERTFAASRKRRLEALGLDWSGHHARSTKTSK